MEPGSSKNVKTITVTGVATVTAAPDQALVVLAVQTQSASASQATGDNAAIMTKVLQALSGIGISKDSIATVSYTVTPVYESRTNLSGPPKILGIVVRNAVQVTVSNFGLVGRAVDVAVEAGANEVQSIIFTLSSSTHATLEKQALQLAIQDADAKAKSMASTLEVQLVGPISVNPSFRFVPAMGQLSATGPQTPIQPGTLQLTVTVEVTYQFA